jgi:hypothetical protein
MANRFPLIVDGTSLSIKELPLGDNLDLTGSAVVNGAWQGNSISTTYTDAKIVSVSNTTPISAITSSGAVTISLLTSGVAAATYGNATFIPTFTVDAFGRITSASNVAISATVANTNITGLITSGQIASVANTQITGTLTAAQLQNTGVTATTYGGASSIPAITVDAQGRITSASNVAVVAGVSAGRSLAFSIVFGS